ncbi:MAG: ABC transporter permease [Dehalococcoidia bacterium]
MARDAVAVGRGEEPFLPKEKHPIREFFGRMFKEKPLAGLGLVIVAVMLFMAIFATWIAPEGIMDLNHGDEGLGPSTSYWFGTDQLGRDIFSRIVHGARISVIVGLSATALGLAGATVLGVVSGYFGGKLDMLIQRFVDGWLAFPYLLFVLAIVGIFQDVWIGPEGGMFKVIAALGIAYSVWISRIIRGHVLAVKESQYIDAARAIGCSHWRIIRYYILPNIMVTIIIVATLSVGWAVLSEAALSFLGLGVPPPFPSWGKMLDEARHFVNQNPWGVVFPGLAITLFVFGVQVFGDGLRDLLDPRLRGAKHAGFGR